TERGKLTYEQLMEEYLAKKQAMDPMMQALIHSSSQVEWRRIPGQHCKIPNKMLYTYEVGTLGSMSCAFSTCGVYLAVACAEMTQHFIKIYDIINGNRIGILHGPADLIYNVSWANDCDSSDGTVSIWLMDERKAFNRIAVLFHSSFVYSASFHPAFRHNGVISTGSGDGCVRLWICDFDAILRERERGGAGRPAINGWQNTKVLQNLTGHTATVNSIVFDPEGTKIYSADSDGVIRVWSCHTEDGEGSIGSLDYTCIKVISSGFGVRNLSMHPTGRKLLVFLMNGQLKAMDTRIFRFVTEYKGLVALNTQYNSHHIGGISKAIFSPCGNTVYAGSHDGRVLIWRADSGQLMGLYETLGVSGRITDISYHPKDYIAAFSAWGTRQPLPVLTWSEAAMSPSTSIFTYISSSEVEDKLEQRKRHSLSIDSWLNQRRSQTSRSFDSVSRNSDVSKSILSMKYQSKRPTMNGLSMDVYKDKVSSYRNSQTKEPPRERERESSYEERDNVREKVREREREGERERERERDKERQGESVITRERKRSETSKEVRRAEVPQKRESSVSRRQRLRISRYEGDGQVAYID
ncbi:Jouberin, partial [Blyttiomyces sp. JEL0837]